MRTELTSSDLQQAGVGAFFRPRDVVGLGLTHYQLQRMVEEGHIERVGPGLYRLAAVDVVEMGDTVGLRFDLPKDFGGDMFKFWCNVHGKLHGDVLQGEIFVVKPKHG